MTINDYQKAALRTASSVGKPKDDILLNAAMGLCGESGELMDMLKKYKFQFHKLDYDHAAKELGDIAWYLALGAHALGMDLETVLQMNVEKLMARYPDGFEVERSLYRKDDDI